MALQEDVVDSKGSSQVVLKLERLRQERFVTDLLKLAYQVGRTSQSAFTIAGSVQSHVLLVERKPSSSLETQILTLSAKETVCDYFSRTGQRTPLVIEDLHSHPQFGQLEVVKNGPKLTSYLGIPLFGPRSQLIGALCVIDPRLRQFDRRQAQLLQEIAAVVLAEVG